MVSFPQRGCRSLRRTVSGQPAPLTSKRWLAEPHKGLTFPTIRISRVFAYRSTCERPPPVAWRFVLWPQSPPKTLRPRQFSPWRLSANSSRGKIVAAFGSFAPLRPRVVPALRFWRRLLRPSRTAIATGAVAPTMESKMKTFAEFQILGRIGKVREVGHPRGFGAN